MRKIRKGDQVIVISGRDKGRHGAVVQVLEGAVVVENINRVKRHTKPNPQANQPGGIIEREAPIHQSNVALIGGAGKAERVGYKTLGDGRKVRVLRRSGEQVDA